MSDTGLVNFGTILDVVSDLKPGSEVEEENEIRIKLL
jgi:hypothetical protein